VYVRIQERSYRNIGVNMENKYINDVFIQGIARIAGGVISFVSIFILTYLFDESAIGEYNLILSYINLFVSIFTLWLSQSILRYYEDDSQFNTVISFMLLVSIFSTILLFFVSNLLSQGLSIHVYIYLFIMVFYNIFDAYFRRKRELLNYLGLELSLSLGRIFPMIILAIITHDYNVIFISQYVILTIYITLFTIKKRLLKNFRFNLDMKLLRQYLRFGLPLLGLSISNWVLISSDLYIIKYYTNNENVGIYSTNYSLGNSIYMIFSLILINAFHPIIMKMWDKSKVETELLVSNVVNYYLLFMLPLVFYGCYKSETLLGLFKGSSYSDNNEIFIWTTLGIFVYGLSLLYHKYFELIQKTGYILVFNLIAAIVNVILNVVLIPILGFSVAAFATFLSYLVYLCLVILSTYKHFRINFSWLNVIIIISSIIIFVFCERFIVSEDNMVTFIIEGVIYVSYTICLYQLFKLVDVKPILLKPNKLFNRGK
jgi:O-antigen/teichoic acid export membrane protein